MFFVLKHNDSFAVVDPAGNILGRNEKEHDIADGLITRDTRFLSRYILSVDGKAPELRGSGLEDNNVIFNAELSSGNIGIRRTLFVYNDSLFEKLSLKNNGPTPARAHVQYEVDADFLDLFELRGAVRQERGRRHAPQLLESGIAFNYTGIDNLARGAEILCSEPFRGENAEFDIELSPRGEKDIYLRVDAGNNTSGQEPGAKEFMAALEACRGFIARQVARRPQISSSNPLFDKWVHANAVDIALLTTEKPTGPYPYAGIPWYSCPFGRDGIITAFQLLWQDPALARGVLALLARHQASESSAFHDSAPGKIMHEIRSGEMAAMKEIPHTPYYGTADATPLFVSLAGAYFERTGDIAFIESLWPHIERAITWIDDYGDSDGDGFVEYQRGAESGLGNQGWKDSVDAISHADGELAPGPIALCEVQGYVYDAKRAAAGIAHALGHDAIAANLDAAADALKEKFNATFWSEELGTYALALDGRKNPCLVSSSNPGHLLFSGIATPERAQKTAERLMAPDMFSGWGIRTLSSREKRYEPVKPPEGYHNGTVWVHDTAICAAGFARYGMEDKASTLLSALFDAAQHFPGLRLPELFGGLPRERGKPPARYPVACSPQAWASASESLLLQSMLGIRIDGREKKVWIANPRLPSWLDSIEITRLSVGDLYVSLRFHREGDVTVAEVAEISPGLECRLAA